MIAMKSHCRYALHISWICTLVLCGGCARRTHLTLPGYLYMGVGRQIVRLNLTTHKQKSIFTLPEPLKVDVLSKVNDQTLLVSTFPVHRIAILNLKTRHWMQLRSGWKATAFPKLGLFVFYDSPKPGFYAQELYWATLKDPARRHRIDPGPFPIQMPVVRIGATRFAYTSWRKKHTQRLWSYDLVSRRFNALPVTGAYPEQLLKQDTLLCAQIGVRSHPYFVFSLRNKSMPSKQLPLESWYTPVHYIKALNYLLVGHATSSLFVAPKHRWALLIYDIRSGKTESIAHHTEVGLDSLVWIPTRP